MKTQKTIQNDQTHATVTLVCMDGRFAEAEASIITPGFTPAPNFSAEGANRKFIVLADGKGSLVLAIGPVMGDNSYYHKDILERVRGRFAGYSISGGGNVTASWSTYEKKWSLKFGGSSGDFGVYDYRLLAKDVRAKVAEQLGLVCRFEWHG